MNKQILYIAVAGTLALGMAGQAAAYTFEGVDEDIYADDDISIVMTGEKYVLREAIRSDKAAELAVFEVTGGVDEDVYADDDISIVMTGEKYVLREAIRSDKVAELAVFEVTGGVDEDIYADDDISIVMTGAR